MAEYIYADAVRNEGNTWMVTSPSGERRERIVRCRDCKHAIEHRSKSILGTELVTLICSGLIQGAYSEGADVEPDGFCAWASERDQNE